MPLGQLVPVAISAILTLTGITWAIVSWKKSGARISAELAVSELDDHGVLSVQHANGKSTIMTLPSATGEEPRRSKHSAAKFEPVNVVFVRNGGRTAITVSRCTYYGNLGDTGFQFGPQPGASRFGDLLPKRLEPGQDAVLVHAYQPMKAFLRQVMQDHGVSTSTWSVVLTLGDGRELPVLPSMGLAAADTMQDEDEAAYRIHRQEVVPTRLIIRKQPRWPRRRHR